MSSIFVFMLRWPIFLTSILVLQCDLSSVIKRTKRNNISLHEDKFELLFHNPQNILLEHAFAVQCQTYEVSDGNLLYPIDKVKDLGIILSSDLSWGSRISTIASSERKVAAWVLSAFKTRNMPTIMTLYQSLVRSHIEYCFFLKQNFYLALSNIIKIILKKRKIAVLRHRDCPS